MSEVYHTYCVRILFGLLCLAIFLVGCRDDGTPRNPANSVSTTNPGGDDVEMVLIPAGDFLMGDEEEGTAHHVYLDAYKIDKYPVTNARYKRFMEATGHRSPLYWDDVLPNQSEHPVAGVSIEDAEAYAKWTGKRIPTEAEWEKAARGGLIGKRYPWGDMPPDRNLANFGDNEEATTPVDKYPPNALGLYDMAGNVFELCIDKYQWDYYMISPRKNPKGPKSGDHRIARGGSWRSIAYYLRCSSRYDVYWIARAYVDVGFRCVRNVSVKAAE